MNYMLEKEKLEMIQNATALEINDMLQAVLERYRELYPNWDISTISIEKAVDKNQQLDQIIALIEKLKEHEA